MPPHQEKERIGRPLGTLRPIMLFKRIQNPGYGQYLLRHARKHTSRIEAGDRQEGNARAIRAIAKSRLRLFVREVFPEHSLRIDRDELGRSARQDFALLVLDLGDVVMFASGDVIFPTFDRQPFPEGNHLQIPYVHFGGDRDYVADLVHFAHGLIEDRRDDAAVAMLRRSPEFLRQPELADELLVCLVESEFEMHSIWIVRPAGKADVFSWLVNAGNVSVDFLMLGHR